MALIACRLTSYGRFEETAWTHIPQIGIRHVEFEIPADRDMSGYRRRLSEHGLTASSLHAICDITRDDAVEVMAGQLAVCGSMGVGTCFLSVRAGDTDRSVIWDRLRRIGDEGEKNAATVVLETHPDLVVNAELTLATMRAVDHPRIRVNFDTANVYYYNRGVTAHGELEQIIDYVDALHLKDSTGACQTWNFPTLGEGIVDFPRIFAMLDDRGFRGPCTMELEGCEGVELSEDAQLKMVADSAAYLRRIGALVD